MADTAPRVGFDSILTRGAGLFVVSSEASGFPPENLTDWRPATKWAAAASDNLLANGTLLKWTAGAAAAPDDWTLAGASASIARETGATNRKKWPYSAAVTRAGADATLSQSLADETPHQGRYVTALAWVKTTANEVRLEIADGVGSTAGAGHTGGGAFELLTVEALIDPAASEVTARLAVRTSDGTAYVDCLALLPGRWGAALPQGAPPAEPATPQRVTIRAYPVAGQLLGANPWFFDWTAGAAAAPDGWTLAGASASIAQDEAAPKIDRFAAVVTRSGADAYLEQALPAATVAALAGKLITAGGWVLTDTIGAGHVGIRVEADTYPAGGLEYDAANLAADAWEWVEAPYPVPVPADVSAITIFGRVTSDTAVAFDGPLAVEGDEADETPHAAKCDYLGIAGHNLGSGAVSVTVESSADNWATVTERLAELTPDTDAALWRTWTPATAPAWRITLTAAAGSITPEIGALALGEKLTLPAYAAPGLDFYHRQPIARTAQSETGQPLGRALKYEAKRFRLELPWLDRADIVGVLAAFWSHAKLRPFFFAHNDGAYPDEAILAWIPDSAAFSAPLEHAYRTALFGIDMEAVAE
jgi:hypothetical protein